MKQKFIISTIILIIGGFLTKVLGMLIKIIVTRLIGVEGMGIYMLIMPTFSLFIALAQLGFPISISKIVSEDRKNNKNIIFSSFFLSIIINLILFFIILLISPILSKYLLHDTRCYLPLISIALVLPFISISSILRGYFFGKERMFPHVLSNVCEQIIRLIILMLIVPSLIVKGIDIALSFIVLVNIISEGLSIVILYLFLPKKIKLSKNDIIPDKTNMKDVLNTSIPTTSSRLIGLIGYFFEPIILTSTLLFLGYKSNWIISEYGLITGFVMPLLMIPSFFTQAISQALIPVVSRAYSNRRIPYIKAKLYQSLIISITIGLAITFLLMINPEFFLKFIYNTTEGSHYLKVLAPFFLFYYIQIPLLSVLQATNHAKEGMISTLKGTIMKTALLFILSLFKIGMYGLIIATIVNIIYVTYNQFKLVRNKVLKKAY